MIVLDVETQQAIPPDRRLDDLRISIAGIFDGTSITFFTEDQLPQLFSILDNADTIVGHNLFSFDYKVLQRYVDFDVAARYNERSFDLLRILERKTGRLMSLNDLAQRNLGSTKLGAGKDAPLLFREGRMKELQEYLAQDLQLTWGLFDLISRTGSLRVGVVLYKEPVEKVVPICVSDR